MATTNSINVKVGYENTDKTRTYTIDGVANNKMVPELIKAKAAEFETAINDSVGTAYGFFVDSNGNRANAIVEITARVVEEEPINLN